MLVQIILLTILGALSNGSQPTAYIAAQQEAKTISRYQKDHTGDGNYHYGYNTTNGITKVEEGKTKNPEAATQDQINEKQGCYSYTSPEGTFVSVVYIADERGYRPITRISYPGTTRHEQHTANPCGPLDINPPTIPEETITTSAPATNSYEVHQTLDSGTLNPSTPSPCANPSPCVCPDEFRREPFAFHTLDGSYVLITFVQTGRTYTPTVQVLPPGWRNFYTCKIEAPLKNIPGVKIPQIIYPNRPPVNTLGPEKSFVPLKQSSAPINILSLIRDILTYE